MGMKMHLKPGFRRQNPITRIHPLSAIIGTVLGLEINNLDLVVSDWDYVTIYINQHLLNSQKFIEVFSPHVPGYDLSRKTWVHLNRVRTAYTKIYDTLNRFGLRSLPNCDVWTRVKPWTIWWNVCKWFQLPLVIWSVRMLEPWSGWSRLTCSRHTQEEVNNQKPKTGIDGSVSYFLLSSHQKSNIQVGILCLRSNPKIFTHRLRGN